MWKKWPIIDKHTTKLDIDEAISGVMASVVHASREPHWHSFAVIALFLAKDDQYFQMHLPQNMDFWHCSSYLSALE